MSHYIYEGQDAIQSGSYICWFELAILESPTDTQPIVGTKGPLVFWSHQLPKPYFEFLHQGGVAFTKDSDLVSCIKVLSLSCINLMIGLTQSLEPIGLQSGNAIGIRICVNGPGQQSVAKSAKLDILLSPKGIRFIQSSASGLNNATAPAFVLPAPAASPPSIISVCQVSSILIPHGNNLHFLLYSHRGVRKLLHSSAPAASIAFLIPNISFKSR